MARTLPPSISFSVDQFPKGEFGLSCDCGGEKCHRPNLTYVQTDANALFNGGYPGVAWHVTAEGSDDQYLAFGLDITIGRQTKRTVNIARLTDDRLDPGGVTLRMASWIATSFWPDGVEVACSIVGPVVVTTGPASPITSSLDHDVYHA